MLLLAACAGAREPAPVHAASAGDPREVRVAATASVGELLDALRRSLALRGHTTGECFVAWDAEASGEKRITVHVGARSRSGALSCGGLAELASELEGRCVFARFFWVAPGTTQTRGLTFYFAEPGVAYARAAVGAAPIRAPASEAVFRAAPPGARLVLGVELDAPGVDPRSDEESAARGGASKQELALAQARPTKRGGVRARSASRGGEAPPEENALRPGSASVLESPAVQRALQDAVARMQACNPSGAGSLVLEWRVRSDGALENVRALSSTVSEEVLGCALELLARASFPEHLESEPVEVCAPVLLDPRLRD